MKEGSEQVVRKAIKLPQNIGQYQLCLWKKTDQPTYASLPQDAVRVVVDLALPSAYLQAHQPKVELRSYFAADDRLYADMYHRWDLYRAQGL